ncbi:hypothetical protein HF086_011304 [Spodoptera exigua]|uniref:Fumarylacetoacetase-like C-terminal domain-containing protein n=1 Tax=Spodoptera exigua TaxID=7107 RepID=A0A922MFJ9_SPOEX|nr:hypothetical protein HF086_011304 [Spodoptera exigua]
MKFVQFARNETPNEVRVGYLHQFGVVDLCCHGCDMPRTMIEILKADIADKIRQLPENNPRVIHLSKVTLLAPITGVDKVIGVAHNYSDHCQDLGVDEPSVPWIFSKFPSTIIGPNQAKVDWQINLAFVIGRKASSVKAADAHKYIFGYTVAQDITEREWMLNQNGVHVMTLYPGDVILTGTPAGIGGMRDPPEFLKPGDVIRSEIQNIGVLTTSVEEF